jgi:transcriptional regulator with XRE-family HTH domain
MSDIKAYFPNAGKHSFKSGGTLPYMGAYGDRLAEAMALAGMAEADGSTLRKDARKILAEALGISVQAVGQVLTGKSNAFSAEISARAARFLRVDHFWLATGEGQPRMPGLSDEAKAFAVRYDQLDANERAKFAAALVLAARNSPSKV